MRAGKVPLESGVLYLTSSSSHPSPVSSLHCTPFAFFGLCVAFRVAWKETSFFGLRRLRRGDAARGPDGADPTPVEACRATLFQTSSATSGERLPESRLTPPAKELKKEDELVELEGDSPAKTAKLALLACSMPFARRLSARVASESCCRADSRAIPTLTPASSILLIACACALKPFRAPSSRASAEAVARRDSRSLIS